jgi:hypothetical protein
MNSRQSLRELILSEDLNRYGNYEEGSPVDAAKELSKLLDSMIPMIEKYLSTAGPFMAETVLEDFLSDFKTRAKEIKLPQQNSQLASIMGDISAKEQEFKDRDAEKAASKTAPAAKEKPAVAAPPPPEDEGSEEEEAAPGTPAVTGKTPHKRNIKVP